MKTNYYQYKNNFQKYSNIRSDLLAGNFDNNIPFITIIIPTYKRESLLKEALESCMNQEGFDDYEVVVVDNDTCENSKNLAQETVESFNSQKLIYYRNQQNIGCFGNFNRCIELSRSNYMVMLHTDDLLSPDHLRTMANIIKKQKHIDLIFPNKDVEINNVILKKSSFFAINQFLEKFISLCGKPLPVSEADFFLHNIVNGCVGALFKKDKALALGGFEEDRYPNADYIFWTKYVAYNNGYLLNDTLGTYRLIDNISLSDSVYQTVATCDYKFQEFLLDKKVVKGFLAKAYHYEAPYIKMMKHDREKRVPFDVDQLYIDMTKHQYKPNIIRKFAAQLYMVKAAAQWLINVTLALSKNKTLSM